MKGGFTLVEILVAVSIFALVVIVIVGALLSISNANLRSQAIRAVIDNLNLAVEGMTRKIRAGGAYHCGGGAPDLPLDCPFTSSSGFSQFAFEAVDGDPDDSSDQISYQLNQNRIEVKDIRISPESLSLTAPEIKVNELKFYVEGAGSKAEGRQPRVIIVLRGTAEVKGEVVTEFNIQTQASQRVLDL